MLRLMHKELKVLIPLGMQVIVDDLAPGHPAGPDSHAAHVHSNPQKSCLFFNQWPVSFPLHGLLHASALCQEGHVQLTTWQSYGKSLIF